MTDAYIPPINETICDDNSNRTTVICKNHTVNTTDQCTGCNNTVGIDAQNKSYAEEQLKMNNSNPSNNTSLASTVHDCAETVNDTNNCVETQIKSNVIRDRDTVLKYVYKKDDKVNISDKSKAHPKNSVRRRKRALYDSSEDARYAESVPLIVNYKTSHPPQGEKPFERIRNVIQNSELADFNIETLHEHIQPNKNSEDIKDKPKKVYFEPKPLQRPLVSEEIDGREEYRDNIKNSKPYDESTDNEDRNSYRTRERNPPHDRESDESVERSDYKHGKTDPVLNGNRKAYRENIDSGERSYRDDKRELSDDRNRKLYKENQDSGEKSDYRDSERPPLHDRNNRPYKNSEDSGERDDYKKNENESPHDSNSKPYNDSNESIEKSDYREGKEPRRHRNKKPYKDSEESDETISIGNKREPLYNRDSSSSDENENSRNKASYSAPRRDSSESREGEQSDEFSDGQGNKRESYAILPRDSNESRESKQSEESGYPKRANSNESQENNESYYNKPSISDYTKPHDRITDSKENYRQEEKPSYRKESSGGTNNAGNRYYKNNDNSNIRGIPNNNEDSEEEEIIAIMKKKNRKVLNKLSEHNNSENKGQSNTSSPIKIKDVDLDDFSYERIQVNDKGIVETAKDTHGNYETDTQVEITPTKQQISQAELIVDGNVYSRSIESIDAPSGPSTQFNSDEVSEGSKGAIIKKINNGEVRPVVEINNESGELNDENSKESLKSSSGNEDTSLETLLGVKLPDGNEQSDKINLPQIKHENADVKQQFERIPLNYNHDKNENQSELMSNSKPVEKSKIDHDDETHNQGTLDVLTPNENQDFDENLNIKFDDLTIKLPEIKLPKDILAYTYEEPNDEDEKHSDTDKDKPFYRYSDEYNSEEKPREKKKYRNDDYDDDYHGYSDFYGKTKKKDSYKKKQQEDDDEDEDVDLYEKFVRERFGKRGSFEKRSEKLQDDSRPVQSNPQLYNTLRQVLKKTEDIEKQAVQSGDPNAGYMWTLEYGQPL